MHSGSLLFKNSSLNTDCNFFSEKVWWSKYKFTSTEIYGVVIFCFTHADCFAFYKLIFYNKQIDVVKIGGNEDTFDLFFTTSFNNDGKLMIEAKRGVGGQIIISSLCKDLKFDTELIA